MKTHKPNKLIHEKSPYLLQHAHNPVDWFTWGDEAFEKARREDKIILLSIGYATCHWCHVMERESFEDEDTAKIMNDFFVCIKLDREERPDIDKIYMDALHAMDQQGGWPLNMFLTPEKKPIMGGTYFPPVAKYGRKSFTEILFILKDFWLNKKEEIIKSSDAIADYLKQEELSPEGTDLPSKDCFEKAYTMFSNYFDETHFGFKTNLVNKFPPSMGLSFLLSYYHDTRVESALNMVEKTLQAMKKGGIYDQVGGGLCRYATDQAWLVPHFEKMLYDNSLFLIALAECYSVTKDVFYKFAYYDIIEYIRRDMSLEIGGIASAEDADSEGEEGKFYIWSLAEFREICGEDSSILEKFWDVTDEGNFEGHTILNQNFHIDFVKENSLKEKSFLDLVAKNREKLLQIRSKRIRPLRDDKVLTSWNALYIRALAIGSNVFEDLDLLSDAKKIHSFLEANLFSSDGRLLRRYREAESKYNAYLTDYSELALANLFLYFASFDISFIEKAVKLCEDTIKLFQAPSGAFFDTGSDAEQLIRRSIDGYDGVEPSGNSTISFVLNFLGSLGIETNRYESQSEKIFKFFAEDLSKRSVSYPFMLKSYHFVSRKSKQIVVTGKKENPEVQKVLSYLKTSFLPNVLVCYHDGNSQNEKILPILLNKFSEDCKIYVCENQTCALPINTLDELKLALVE